MYTYILYSDLYYCPEGWTYILSLQDVWSISIFDRIIENVPISLTIVINPVN